MQSLGLRADGAALQLDTVRALHQTVVSLRAALEASKSELNDLRQKYESKAAQEEDDTQKKKVTFEDLPEEDSNCESLVTVREIDNKFETKIELESKFDVTIKVSANQGDDGVIHVSSDEKVSMAGSKEAANLNNKTNDKFNVQVCITSEDNLIMDSGERDSASDNMNVEGDEVSAR